MQAGYCGVTMFEGKTLDVIIDEDQFKLFDGGKFIRFIANNKLRKAGIKTIGTKKGEDKVVYGKFGYVGCPQKS